MGECFCLCVCCTVFMPGAYRIQKEGVESSRTGVMDAYDLPCGCWKLNPKPFARAESVTNHRAELSHQFLV